MHELLGARRQLETKAAESAKIHKNTKHAGSTFGTTTTLLFFFIILHRARFFLESCNNYYQGDGETSPLFGSLFFVHFAERAQKGEANYYFTHGVRILGLRRVG